jgi:hypothetical protein
MGAGKRGTIQERHYNNQKEFNQMFNFNFKNLDLVLFFLKK